MKVLMIDNYDSFTYNLVQYLGELGAEVEVVRNDQISVDAIVNSDASHVMLSRDRVSLTRPGFRWRRLRRSPGSSRFSVSVSSAMTGAAVSVGDLS